MGVLNVQGNQSGNAMIPFHYFAYWDVPRVILVFHRGQLFLLDSGFKDELDDFDDCYDVYLMPEDLPRDRLPGTGERLATHATRNLGRIPVKDVTFDDFRGRNELDPEILDRIGQSAGIW
jgi:hypothetical protein